MSASREPTRLHLEVDLSEPIRGRIYGRQGGTEPDRHFLGWLGLMSAIEAAAGAGSQREERQEREAV